MHGAVYIQEIIVVLVLLFHHLWGLQCLLVDRPPSKWFWSTSISSLTNTNILKLALKSVAVRLKPTIGVEGNNLKTDVLIMTFMWWWLLSAVLTHFCSLNSSLCVSLFPHLPCPASQPGTDGGGRERDAHRCLPAGQAGVVARGRGLERRALARASQWGQRQPRGAGRGRQPLVLASLQLLQRHLQ